MELGRRGLQERRFERARNCRPRQSHPDESALARGVARLGIKTTGPRLSSLNS